MPQHPAQQAIMRVNMAQSARVGMCTDRTGGFTARPHPWAPTTRLQTALEFTCVVQKALASDIRGQTVTGRGKSQNPGCPTHLPTPTRQADTSGAHCCTHAPTPTSQAGRHLGCSLPTIFLWASCVIEQLVFRNAAARARRML